jgi:hypothetical protein
MMATLQIRAQRTPHRELFNGLIMVISVRRLTESGSFAHAKYHDLQHSRACKKIIGNRTSTKDQRDIEEPPNETSSNNGNDYGGWSGVLGPLDFLADMPINESEYWAALSSHINIRYSVVIRHTVTKPSSGISLKTLKACTHVH